MIMIIMHAITIYASMTITMQTYLLLGPTMSISVPSLMLGGSYG